MGSERQQIKMGKLFLYGFNSVRTCGSTQQVGPRRVPLCAIHQTMVLFIFQSYIHKHI